MKFYGWVVAVALVAACGDDGVNHTPDAADTIDAAIGDSSMPDGSMSGSASVIVTQHGQPLAGVRVYFQRADQTLITAVDTDAAGMASSEVTPGSWVTVMAPYLSNGRPWVETIGGVKPGDVLRVGSPQRFDVELTVSIPKDTGATSYEVYASCTADQATRDIVQDANTASFYFTHSCPWPLDFLVISRDSNGTRQKWLLATDQMPVNNTVAITGTYSAAMRSVSLTATNVPADTDQLTVRYRLAQAGDSSTLFTEQMVFTTFTNQMATATLTVPDLPSIRASAMFSARSPTNYRRLDDGLVPTTTSHTADLSALLSGFATTEQWDRTAGTVTWTAVDATPRDLAFAFFIQTRSVNAQNVSWYRSVVQPHDGAQLVVPKLPVEGFDYNALAGDSGGMVELAMAKVPGGYDAIRARYYDTSNLYAAPVVVADGERALLVEAR